MVITGTIQNIIIQYIHIVTDRYFKKNTMKQRFLLIVDDMHPLSIITIAFLFTIVLTGIILPFMVNLL